MAESLRGPEDHFRKLLDEASLGAAVFDLSGAIEECNPVLSELLGSTAAELAGSSVADLAHPVYRPQLGHLLHELVRGNRRDGHSDAGLVARDGTLHWMRISLFLACTRHGEPDYGIAVFEPITADRRVLDAIHTLATTDDLTGLHNRRGFFLLAEQQWRLAVRKKRELALLYVDLDTLKRINDTHGHAAGDDAIRKTGEILSAACRDCDIVARLGGDEFAVLMVESTEAGVERVRTGIERALASHNSSGRRLYRLSISLGISRFGGGETPSLQEMLAEADRRMYETKRRR